MRTVRAAPFPADPAIDDARAFGAAVRAARTGAKLTREDAAQMLGVAPNTITSIESGKGTVALSTALRAARELGVAFFAVPAAHQESVRRLIRSRSDALTSKAS